MMNPIADALADVEQWHQASIKAGAATRLLMAAAKQASISEPQLSKILEITIRDLQWLSRRGLGPTKRVGVDELASK